MRWRLSLLCSPKRKQELAVWWSLAWPISVALAARLSMTVVDIAFVGHLTTQDLASASLAVVWMMVTSSFLWVGVGSALNTLCSQAYGARNYPLVGIWFQVASLFSTVLIIPVMVAWWFTGPLLRACGFSAVESDLAATFARWSILGLWPNAMYSLVRQFLLAQQDVQPALWVAVVCAVANVGLNQLFIHGAFGWPGLGFIGSPIATASTRVLLLTMISAYAFGWKKYEHPTWNGFSRGALSRARWHTFGVTQALPQMISAALEEWQLQVIAFLAAKLGEVQIATHNSLVNLFYVMTSCMYGLVSSTNIRIAFHLGAGRVTDAKSVVCIASVACTTVGVIVALCFVFAREYVGRVFSDDPAVWHLASKISLLVGAGYAAMAVFYVAMAVLSGAGRPKMVAVSFVVGAWLVCIPLAFVLTDVVHEGLLGLWHALVAGYATVTLIALAAAFRLDWHSASTDAQARAEVQPLLSNPIDKGEEAANGEAGDALVSSAQAHVSYGGTDAAPSA